jgi:hypothetical protein
MLRITRRSTATGAETHVMEVPPGEFRVDLVSGDFELVIRAVGEGVA